MIRSLVSGVVLLSTLLANACDQCGCGPLMGIQPFDRSDNIGLHYRMRYLRGDMTSAGPVSLAKHGGHGASTSTLDTTRYMELYSALEVRGQYWLGERWSLYAAIPLVNNYASVNEVTRADVYAVGDAQLVARYVLLSTRHGGDTTRTRHRLTVGAGAKLPLGQYRMSQYGEELSPDLQPGTGTWDGLLTAEYIVRAGAWGTAVGAVGRLNGTMASGYRFGHSGSVQGEVLRTVRLGPVKWLPSVGAYAEHAAPDRQDDSIQDGTGGTVLFSHIGSRVWWRSLGITLAWQHALAQDMGMLMIPNRERFIAGITYNFNKN